jgi:N-acetylmuramic acid 6-phosphate (MurNAc-6-P) etherase
VVDVQLEVAKPELRERAVRMVAEISDQHESEWAAISEEAATRVQSNASMT